MSHDSSMNMREFHRIKDQGRWASAAAVLLADSAPTARLKQMFGSFWIEAGHHIREQIADDRVLVRLLRHLLVPYDGKALQLFRGENRSRWERGSIGLAWTSSIEIAEMFGCGLNAFRHGGVLLEALVQPTAIISGPNSHSNYLGESQFTVDPFLLSQISVVKFYPPTE